MKGKMHRKKFNVKVYLRNNWQLYVMLLISGNLHDLFQVQAYAGRCGCL